MALNPIAFKIAQLVVPPIARVLCAPAGYGGIGSRESDNKMSAIETVEFTHLFLPSDAGVAELVDRIQKHEPFKALWLAEGLGQILGNRAVERDDAPRDVLTNGEGAAVPGSMQLMVHAGMCLAFARHHLDRIGKTPTTAQIADATRRIADLARHNLLPGYADIGYEAWGMVTQFFYRPLFPTVTSVMDEIDPEHAPLLWHGAGRASYFIDFMPKWNEPWPCFQVVDRMGATGVRRLNLLAGLASAMVLVNMKRPAIFEAVVKARIAPMGAEDAAAFAQGVACGMVMRQDTTPDEAHALSFVRHEPAGDVAGPWETFVGGPSRLAIESLHPKLKREGRLDAICRYRPLDQLMAV